MAAIRAKRGQDRKRLFCLPRAGGDAAIYQSWSNDFQTALQVCAVWLPGRGKRLRARPFKQMSALVPAIVEGIRDSLDVSFAIFGDALGALIAFELARVLRRMKLPQPTHLFLSGHRAPHLHEPRRGNSRSRRIRVPRCFAEQSGSS